jgi:hypothetical protein
MTPPHLSSTVNFDPTAAKAWRSINFALLKTQEILEFVQKNADTSYKSCMSLCLNGLALCAPCAIPVILGTIATIAIFALKLAIGISDQIYKEVVEIQNAAATAAKSNSVYDNLFIINDNIATTHTAVSQILTIVAGIQPKTDLIQARRRMQVVDCTNTTDGYLDNCNKPSCENPARLCDGSLNYAYISQLKGGENHINTMEYYCLFNHV